MDKALERPAPLWNFLDEQQRFDVLRKMRDYGGGFAKALADAWSRADSGNSARLGAAFDDMVRKYAQGGY